MSSQYGELRPTNGWDPFTSLGHTSTFQRVSRLGSVTARHSSSGRQPNFAALNRGRHLHSTGRPSRWVLANILVVCINCSLLIFTVYDIYVTIVRAHWRRNLLYKAGSLRRIPISRLEWGPMPNMMAAQPNIGCTVCDSIPCTGNGRFPDNHFPGQMFPGEDVSRTRLSRTRPFPDKTIPGQMFPGEDVSRTRLSRTRPFPDKTIPGQDVSRTRFFRTITFPDKTFPGQDVFGRLRSLTRRLFAVQDVSGTIALPDRRFPDRRYPANLYK